MKFKKRILKACESDRPVQRRKLPAGTDFDLQSLAKPPGRANLFDLQFRRVFANRVVLADVRQPVELRDTFLAIVTGGGHEDTAEFFLNIDETRCFFQRAREINSALLWLISAFSPFQKCVTGDDEQGLIGVLLAPRLLARERSPISRCENINGTVLRGSSPEEPSWCECSVARFPFGHEYVRGILEKF